MHSFLPPTLLQPKPDPDQQPSQTYEQSVLQSMNQLDEDYGKAMSTLHAETQRNTEQEQELVKEWNRLKAENRDKQRRLESFEMQEANLTGQLTEQSNFLAEQLSPKMLLKDGDLFSQISDLRKEIKDAQLQIDLTEEELAQIRNMYNESKKVQSFNSRRMAELGEVYARVTKHMTDIENSRHRAESHLQDAIYELTSYRDQMVVAHEKLTLKNLERRAELTALQREVDEISKRISQKQVSDEKAMRQSAALLQDLQAEVDTAKELRRKDKARRAKIADMQKVFDSISQIVQRVGSVTDLPSVPGQAWADLVLKQYNDILYRENNLSIFFDDLTNQHSNLLMEMDIIRPKFEKLKKITTFISVEKEQQLIERTQKAIAGETTAAPPKPQKLTINTKQSSSSNLLAVPGGDFSAKFEPPSPCADTFNAMYSNVLTTTKSEVKQDVFRFRTTQVIHQAVLELMGQYIGCLGYIADRCGGHQKGLMQHVVTKKRIYDRLKIGLYPKPKKIDTSRQAADKISSNFSIPELKEETSDPSFNVVKRLGSQQPAAAPGRGTKTPRGSNKRTFNVGDQFKRASTYRQQANTHVVKVESFLSLIGNPNVGGSNRYEDYTPYSTQQLIEIIQTVPNLPKSTAEGLAAKIQSIDMMQFYLGYEDILQFVQTYHYRSLQKFGQLVSVAFENQRDKLNNGLDLLINLLKKVKETDIELQVEISQAKVNAGERVAIQQAATMLAGKTLQDALTEEARKAASAKCQALAYNQRRSEAPTPPQPVEKYHTVDIRASSSRDSRHPSDALLRKRTMASTAAEEDEERQEFLLSRTVYKTERVSTCADDHRQTSLTNSKSLPKLRLKTRARTRGKPAIRDIAGTVRNKVILAEVRKFETGLKRVKDLQRKAENPVASKRKIPEHLMQLEPIAGSAAAAGLHRGSQTTRNRSSTRSFKLL